jgi:hypothetical protein
MQVTPTERIIAKQNYPALRQRLEDELEVKLKCTNAAVMEYQ